MHMYIYNVMESISINWYGYVVIIKLTGARYKFKYPSNVVTHFLVDNPSL